MVEDLKLDKKISGVTIIQGFPGFGLVGTIATEFLINHLKTDMIGKIWFEDVSPSIAIHQGKMVYPLEVHFSKKFNLLILHTMATTKNQEWKLADIILKLAKEVKAKQIISLEGVSSTMKENSERIFFFSNREKITNDMKKLEATHLNEGIIMGVTSAMFLKSDMPFSSVFAETYSQLPDSKAAAGIIKFLDGYLGLNVDYKPLLKTAEEFEQKIKSIMGKSKIAEGMQEKIQQECDKGKTLRHNDFVNYVG